VSLCFASVYPHRHRTILQAEFFVVGTSNKVVAVVVLLQHLVIPQSSGL
jgi:hypothetical protein